MVSSFRIAVGCLVGLICISSAVFAAELPDRADPAKTQLRQLSDDLNLAAHRDEASPAKLMPLMSSALPRDYLTARSPISSIVPPPLAHGMMSGHHNGWVWAVGMIAIMTVVTVVAIH